MSAKIIPLTPRNLAQNTKTVSQISFDRYEIGLILNIYGQMVSKGLWKDYAMDMLPARAVFSVYRKASENPLYQIIKTPALRNKQGQFSIIAPGGLILKRGHDLKAVLCVFDKQRFSAL
ncbi:MAG: DUF2794 domain-containing protein [Robiginitomaculum sp.]